MKLATGLAVVLCVAACGGKKDDKAEPAPGSANMTGDKMGKPMPGSGEKKTDMPPMPPPGQPMPDAGAGSGSGSGSGSLTAEGLEKRYEECWGFYNDSKYDDFKACFAAGGVNDVPGSGGPDLTRDQVIANLKEFKTAMPDQKGSVQLAIASGNTVIGVALLTGTQSGPMQGASGTMPASNKKVGLFIAQVLSFDDTGKVTRESDYFDGLTMMGQLQPDTFKGHRAAIDKPAMDKDVALAKGDATEKANLDAVGAFLAAFNKHDAKATADLVADDVVWSELTEAADQDKKSLLAGAAGVWKAFSDLKLTPSKSWAAGAYVAQVEQFEGTNDGDLVDAKAKSTLPKTGKKISVPVLAIYKLDGGKVKRAWIFYQSAAMLQQLGVL